MHTSAAGRVYQSQKGLKAGKGTYCHHVVPENSPNVKLRATRVKSRPHAFRTDGSLVGQRLARGNAAFRNTGRAVVEVCPILELDSYSGWEDADWEMRGKNARGHASVCWWHLEECCVHSRQGDLPGSPGW
jgi:hypothetical protein